MYNMLIEFFYALVANNFNYLEYQCFLIYCNKKICMYFISLVNFLYNFLYN